MNIISNHPMSLETTFKCGGTARFFVAVENMEEYANLLKFHGNKKKYILGNGSKTLCNDNGFDGLVISTKNLSKIELTTSGVVCECGVNFFSLHSFLAEHSLSGMEPLFGIPASVGGAVIMNAGAFGAEMSNFVEMVEIYENGFYKIIPKEEILFEYRKCSLKGKNISRVWLKLKKGEKNAILNQQNLYFTQRKEFQPLEYGSAGSIFKRNKNIISSKIIDKLGLKGVKIGGAEISTKHSGFIINKNHATATDILTLINYVKENVLKEMGIILEEEIIIME